MIDNSIEGTFTVRDLAQPCECPDFTEVNEFVGSGSILYNHSASNSSWAYSLQHSATGTVTVSLDEYTGNGSRYMGTPNGSGSINDSETDLDDNPPETETLQLAGPLMPSYNTIPQAKFLLNFDWTDCRYNVTIESVIQGGGGLPAHIGTAHSGWKPIPESGVLSGNIAIPGHSVLWAVSQRDAVGVYIPTSAFGAAIFVNVVGWFNQAGEATMTWNFQPAEE